MLDKAKAREIAINYANEVQHLLNPKKVIFFGSYINGNPHNGY